MKVIGAFSRSREQRGSIMSRPSRSATYWEDQTGRCRFPPPPPPPQWVCPRVRCHSPCPPCRQSLASPCRWLPGPTSGAFRRETLNPGRAHGVHVDTGQRQSATTPRVYLGDDEAARHAQAGLGSKVAGDHDPQARFGEAELGRAGVHDLVHHYHRAAAVGLGGLHWGRRVKTVHLTWCKKQ